MAEAVSKPPRCRAHLNFQLRTCRYFTKSCLSTCSQANRKILIPPAHPKPHDAVTGAIAPPSKGIGRRQCDIQTCFCLTSIIRALPRSSMCTKSLPSPFPAALCSPSLSGPRSDRRRFHSAFASRSGSASCGSSHLPTEIEGSIPSAIKIFFARVRAAGSWLSAGHVPFRSLNTASSPFCNHGFYNACIHPFFCSLLLRKPLYSEK